MLYRNYVSLSLLVSVMAVAAAFVPAKKWGLTRPSQVQLGLFDKMFEEEGPLGKGITVGKVQVALLSPDRKPDSIYGLLERNARAPESDDPYDLARLCYDVCMALLRKKDSWIAACSESKWFSGNDEGKAESQYNKWADKEAAKFEKEHVPDPDSDEKPGGPTVVVVSIVIELQGDETKFDGAGFSLSGTQEVLSSLASDCMVEEGECVNAVEVFWTPSEAEEVLSQKDMYMDFPELVDL